MARTKLVDIPNLKATDAIEIAKKLVNAFKSNPINMQAFAQATGYSLKSSGLHKKIADLKRYGLIDGRGDTMYATDLAKRIGAQRDQNDYDSATSQMVLNIPLFKQLYDVFQSDTSPKEADFFTQLLNITHQDQAELKPISEEIRKLYIDAVRYISMKSPQPSASGFGTGDSMGFNVDFNKLIGDTGQQKPSDDNLLIVEEGIQIKVKKDINHLQTTMDYLAINLKKLGVDVKIEVKTLGKIGKKEGN